MSLTPSPVSGVREFRGPNAQQQAEQYAQQQTNNWHRLVMPAKDYYGLGEQLNRVPVRDLFKFVLEMVENPDKRERVKAALESDAAGAYVYTPKAERYSHRMWRI